MTDCPWETEPDSLDFQADGLRCAMRRGGFGIWCGYVGIDEDHPLYGLPFNHPLKLPADWFKGRSTKHGFGSMDLLLHALSGATSVEESCPISLALEVHGGITFAGDSLSDLDPKLWWFGFDCGHAGDYAPGRTDTSEIQTAIISSMPEELRSTMFDILRHGTNHETNYRDQQYVVSECQSLASQLIAVKAVLTKENIHGRVDGRCH